MASESEELKTLIAVRSEIEAAAIVGALAEEGIRAESVGVFTAGFKAEAPGSVSVIVAESDLTRAQALLVELKRLAKDMDWSKVDVNRTDDSVSDTPPEP
jgi:hypothetical protein